ncbi:oxidoreductase [Streptomyces sp. NPDC126503]|uniref:DUF7847 domain-containing protein n=1 Tax=Streptomyces sp. NPDC126503 TaxID=3155315 RepID=UPI00331DC496
MTYPPAPPPYGYGGYPPPPPKPGVIPLAPLGLGAILSGAFGTFGRHWKQLLGLAAAVYGGAILLVGAALLLAFAAVGDLFPAVFDTPDGQEPPWDDVRPLLFAFVCVWIAGTLVVLCANAVMAAACPAVVQEAVLGRSLTFGALWRRSWARMPSVLGTVILTSLALAVPLLLMLVAFVGMVIGMIASVDTASGLSDSEGWTVALIALATALLVTPLALWIWVKFSLAPAAAVMEGQGAFASMRRSSDLVRGSWWRVFGILLLVGLMTTVVSWLIQQILSLVVSTPLAGLDFSDGEPATVIAAVVVVVAVMLLGQLVSQVIVSVFPPLVTALLYVDQRLRKENLGPELARAAGY